MCMRCLYSIIFSQRPGNNDRERLDQDYPEWVYFSFRFNTEMFYEIQEEANRILFSKPPRVAIGGYWTLNIGDLYLIIEPYGPTEKPDTQTISPATYFIRISFQTMNLTYTDELNNKSSALYIFINKLFCSDIDRILRDRIDLFPTYMQCQIDVFGGEPPRANFSLQFQDLRGTDRSTVKENAIQMIIENVRREDYMG
ncbi:hypothetical protein EGW08_023691, partial [Elysia chlorotica]